MGKYHASIKVSIERRVATSHNVPKAYHNLKTDLYLAELVWEKQIAEIEETAKFQKRDLTDKEARDIKRFSDGLNRDREKRLDTEALERSGWKPGDG